MTDFDPLRFSSPATCKFRTAIREREDARNKAAGKPFLSDYELEGVCFTLAPVGLKYGDVRAEFCMNLMRWQWPGYIQLESGPYVNTFAHRVIRAMCRYKLVHLMGCAGCVAGDTRLLDPVTRKTRTVADFHEHGDSPLVMTLYGPRIAGVPFVKGVEPLYEVTLSDGSRFRCTAQHRLLGSTGFRELREISVGDDVLSYDLDPRRSISGNAQPTHGPSGVDFLRTGVGFPGSYSACSHLCDEPLRLIPGIGRSSFPSPDGALECTGYASSLLGVRGNESHDSRLWLSSILPSTWCIDRLLGLQGSPESLHFGEASRPPWSPSSQSFDLSQPDSAHPLPFEGPVLDSLHSDQPYSFFDREQIQRSWGLTVSPKLVLSITKGPEEVFFDLQVPDGHHYFAEGAIHHNSGKSTIAAAYVETCWKFSPWNTSAFISTTTAAAGQARSWGIAKDLHRNDRFKVGKLVEYLTLITMEEAGGTENRDYRDAVKAVLVPKGGGTESDNAIAAIVGQHNTNVFWLVDEFPFMPIGILTGRLNVMANPFWQFIGLGNMPKEGDPMYQDAEPVNGWDSIDPDSATGWETRSGGWCEYLDGEKSPNLVVEAGKKPPFKGVISRAMLDDIERSSGGVDTPGYWNQARGFPKRGIAHDTVLTRELLMQYKACEKPLWSGDKTKCLAGLDLGFREDGDPCVLQFSRMGTELDGRKILALDPDTVRLFVKVGSSEPFEMQIAHQVVDECMKRGCHDLELDVSGEGGIISQRIAEVARERGYPLTIYPTSFAGAPDENVRFRQGDRMVDAKDLFDRKVTQLWMSFRLCVQNGRIRGMSQESRSTRQLRMRRVIQDEKKRMSIETKKQMKKRLKHSPDDADSAVLNVSLALRLGLPNEPHDPRSDHTRAEQKQTQDQPRRTRYSAHADKSRYAQT